eukprot:scaffold5903_cov165-Ochromonas_danica.AAC.6
MILSAVSSAVVEDAIFVVWIALVNTCTFMSLDLSDRIQSDNQMAFAVLVATKSFVDILIVLFMISKAVVVRLAAVKALQLSTRTMSNMSVAVKIVLRNVMPVAVCPLALVGGTIAAAYAAPKMESPSLDAAAFLKTA